MDWLIVDEDEEQDADVMVARMIAMTVGPKVGEVGHLGRTGSVVFELI